MKRLFVFLIFIFWGYSLTAQTLFSYGKHKVSKEEFLTAFRRNNTSGNSEQALRDYLALYISFKLKVQAALDQKMDTLPGQINDLLNFRRQLEADYYLDNGVIRDLSKEAYARSQQDIRISHIFIPFNTNGELQTATADTTAAFDQISKAFEALKAGSPFAAVATRYSGDPNVKTNLGDIGFITVFSLPYEMESIIYTLQDGSFSRPYRSNGGYHIFMRTATRPAVGTMSAAQILLAYSPASSAEEKLGQKKLADSLYGLLKGGADFTTLAKRFSAERNVTVTGGTMPEITVGRYDPAFEAAVFGLEHDGDISVPFETAFGMHIVKRIRHFPVSNDSTMAEALFKDRIVSDDRFIKARSRLSDQVLIKVGYRKQFQPDSLLWQLSDSYLITRQFYESKNATATTALFAFEKEVVTIKDWLTYLESVKSKYPAGSLPYPDLMSQFISASAESYYRKHLEDYDPSFRQRLTEFSEGNLLFEIMERQVWDKAANDRAGLEDYYNKHKEQYRWGPSANAIAFNTADPETAEKIVKNMSEYVAKWKTLAESSAGKIVADSARYELEQIPGEKSNLLPGTVTRRITDTATGSTHFMYLLDIIPQPAQRSFNEARGMVINDYQSVVESRWISGLKKKYRVKVNEKLLQTLVH